MNLEEIKEMRESFVDEDSDEKIIQSFDWLILEVERLQKIVNDMYTSKKGEVDQ